jgi:DNA-directed RNA polymerase specialized sigma24 family protein
MRKTKEVLRLRLELGLGQRQIARSCGMGLATVHDYLERAAAGIGWPLPEGLKEEDDECCSDRRTAEAPNRVQL